MKLRLKRPLALLLTAVMVLGFLPTTALAAGGASLTTLTLTKKTAIPWICRRKPMRSSGTLRRHGR